jgi:F-type H+-transporting ATPase subunit a
MPQQNRIMIAQAGHGGEEGKSGAPSPHAEAAGTHASTEHGGHHQYKLGDIPDAGLLFSNALIVVGLMVLGSVAATRRLEAVPGKLQNFAEFLVEALQNFCRGIIGPGGEKHLPLVGTLFLFIFFSNLWGMVPGFHAPTANLSTTLALGLIVFVYVQYLGIKNNGLKNHLLHFAGPKLDPLPLRLAVAALLFPIEVISELVKPFTLAMRLFGNIFGEDTVIIVLATLACTMVSPFIPLQFPIMVLGLLTSFVQAMVFSLLTCIYISLQSHHDHDEHDEHGHGTAHAHAAAH